MEKVALILFGFVLAFVPKWLDRKRKIKSHWNAISAEITRIKSMAEMLIQDEILSPLFRLPIKSYEISFSMLLSEGAVKKGEVHVLEEFYDLVQEINRGLDQSALAVSNNDKARTHKEFSRFIGKSKKLIQGIDEQSSYIEPVELLLKKKCSRKLVEY